MEGGRTFQLTQEVSHRVDQCSTNRAWSILYRGLGTWSPAKGKFLCLLSPHPSNVPCASSLLTSGEAAGALVTSHLCSLGPGARHSPFLAALCWPHAPTYLLVEALPVVLRHQSEECKKGPGKGVEAGVAVVRVLACLQAPVALGTCPTARHTDFIPCCEGPSAPETLAPQTYCRTAGSCRRDFSCCASHPGHRLPLFSTHLYAARPKSSSLCPRDTPSQLLSALPLPSQRKCQGPGSDFFPACLPQGSWAQCRHTGGA